MTLDSALKLGHAYEETKKDALQLRRDFTQNSEIDQINKFQKHCRSRDRNPNPEVIMKCKFCSGKNNKGNCPAYGKICNNCRNKDNFAKCSTKMKDIHSLNQEYSDNTGQDNSLSDFEEYFWVLQWSVNNDDINFENTNNRNSFTERLSDNSNNQVLSDNLKVTDQKNISVQNNKSNYDNLQNT